MWKDRISMKVVAANLCVSTIHFFPSLSNSTFAFWRIQYNSTISTVVHFSSIKCWCFYFHCISMLFLYFTSCCFFVCVVYMLYTLCNVASTQHTRTSNISRIIWYSMLLWFFMERDCEAFWWSTVLFLQTNIPRDKQRGIVKWVVK